jgi:hypothetical protein
MMFQKWSDVLTLSLCLLLLASEAAVQGLSRLEAASALVASILDTWKSLRDKVLVK